MITLYSKGSIATAWGAYIVGKESDSIKPWAVFLERDGRLYQSSKWYAYRGWAERALKAIRADLTS